MLKNLAFPIWSPPHIQHTWKCPFLQGLLGRRRSLSRLGLCGGWCAHSHCLKVSNPLLCSAQWCRVLAGRQVEAVLSTFRSRKGGFKLYFGAFFGVTEQGGPGHYGVQ